LIFDLGTPHASGQTSAGLRPAAKGYYGDMRTDDDTRNLEQEVAAGQSETTPVAVISSVIGIIAILFVVALVLAVVAYVLA
jgi:hypothetical protein